jgi:hypothetical protein
MAPTLPSATSATYGAESTRTGDHVRVRERVRGAQVLERTPDEQGHVALAALEAGQISRRRLVPDSGQRSDVDELEQRGVVAGVRARVDLVGAQLCQVRRLSVADRLPGSKEDGGSPPQVVQCEVARDELLEVRQTPLAAARRREAIAAARQRTPSRPSRVSPQPA